MPLSSAVRVSLRANRERGGERRKGRKGRKGWFLPVQPFRVAQSDLLHEGAEVAAL